MAHITVKQIVEDVIPIKERMQDDYAKVCCVAFSNSDNFAICVVLNSFGKLEKTLFVSGRDKYKNETQKLLIKLNRISDYYEHDVSRKIVDFCKENRAQVISITDLEDVSKHFEKT